MFSGKPVIGIAGGIGSGKSFVARLLGEMKCAVIDSDAQVREAYEDPAVRQTLKEWWGDEILLPDGGINRSAIAKRIFTDSDERRRLEGLLHPMVNRARIAAMAKLAGDTNTVAFVWDTPLLFETGLNRECDAVIFVDVPFEQRLERVARGRGWDRAELQRRENLQWPLDRKRDLSDHVVQNTADVGEARSQVRAVLSRILEHQASGARTRGAPPA
jgi:dephospho-CoA kinase